MRYKKRIIAWALIILQVFAGLNLDAVKVSASGDHTLTIIDEFYNANNTFDYSNVRETKSFSDSLEYSYTSDTPINYYCISETSYSGTATGDTTLTFKYKKFAESGEEIIHYTPIQDGYGFCDSFDNMFPSRFHITYQYKENGVQCTGDTTTDGSYFNDPYDEANYYVRYDEREYYAGTLLIPNAGYKKSDFKNFVVTNLNNNLPIDDTEVTVKLEQEYDGSNTRVKIILYVNVNHIDLTVKDKYYKENGTLDHTDIRLVKCEDRGVGSNNIPYGGTYSYDALEPEGYDLISESNYSGVFVQDTEIVFKYKKSTPSYNIKVIDEYYEADGTTLEKSEVRETAALNVGVSYTRNALEPEGYTLISDATVSGIMNSDKTIIFKYKSFDGNKRVCLIYDAYYDESGNLEHIDLRLKKEYVDLPYMIEALNPEGYLVFSEPAIQSYIVYSTFDCHYVFKYLKISSCSQVIDDPDNTYNIKVVDEYYESDGTTLRRSETRVDQRFTAGTKYSYEALDCGDIPIIISDTQYSGTLDSDVTITFKYKYINRYTVYKVYDAFYDESGNLEDIVLRVKKVPEDCTSEDLEALGSTNHPELKYPTYKSALYYLYFEDTLDVIEKYYQIHVFCYRKFPKYTLKVIDEYYKSDGTTLEKSEVRETKMLYKNVEHYKYNALEPEGYTLISDESYSGTLSSDKTVTFKYKKIQSYTLKVVDEYYKSNGTTLEKSETRVDTTLNKGTAYSYDPLNPEGYALISGTANSYYDNNILVGYVLSSDVHFSGTLDSDMIITFKYKKNPSAYTLTVVDEYYESDGTTLEKSVVRETKTLPKGSNYSYNALNPEGYIRIGSIAYLDTLDSDKTITFKYKKLSSYTLTVVDEYYESDETTLEKSEVRETTIVNERGSYRCYAIDPRGYTRISDYYYSGTMNSDKTIIFKYKKISITEEVIIKYQAIHSNFDPVPDFELNGEITDENGYITMTDKVKYIKIGENEKYYLNDTLVNETGEPIIINHIDTKMKVYYNYGYFGGYNIDDCDYMISLRQIDSTTYVANVYVDKPYTKDYKVKYKAEYSDGSPAEGYSIFNQSTNEDGYIEKEDKFSLNVFPYSGIDCLLNDESVGGFSLNYTPETSYELEVPYDDSQTAKYQFNWLLKDDNTDLDKFSDITANENCTIKEVVSGVSATVVINAGDPPVITHTLKIIDKYYETDGTTLEKSEDREIKVLSNNTAYSYNALEPDGYTCISETTYAGNLTEDTTVTFKYKKNPPAPPTITKYNVKVIDKYVDSLGFPESESTRVDIFVDEESAYSYDALDVIGYTVDKATESGIVSGDVTITFTYQKDAVPSIPDPVVNYNLKVINRLLDENGDFIEDNVKEDKTVPNNTPYSYTADVIEGYSVDKNEVVGTVTSDVIIVFTYTKIPKYTLKVVDEYYNTDGTLKDKSIRDTKNLYKDTAYSYDALNPEGYDCISDETYAGNLTENTTITFKYKKIPTPKHNLKVIDRFITDGVKEDKVREDKEVPEGTAYSYNAKEVSGYTVDKDKQSGVVTEDTVVIFKYTKTTKSVVTPKPSVSPEPTETPKPTATPAPTKTPEPSSEPSSSPEPSGSPETSPEPSDSPEPVVTPEPSDSPEPTVTPEPMDSPEPVVTPEPTKSPKPTDSPKPTKTPKPSTTPKSAKYILKVIDKYIDADGKKIKSTIRVHKTVKLGDKYSYKALKVKDYTLTSKTKYKGIIKSNTTLVFLYKKNPDEDTSKDFKVTVIDKYVIVSSKSSTTSTFGGFTKDTGVRVEKGAYSYNVTRRRRCVDTYAENAKYGYKALENTKFNVIGKSEYSGIIKKDNVVEFTYLLKGYDPEDIPVEIWEISPDPIPYAPEPKTGIEEEDVKDTNSSSPVYPVFVFSALVVTGVAYKRKKRQK